MSEKGLTTISLKKINRSKVYQYIYRKKQTSKMQHFGKVLSEIVMPDLETQETESTLELNFIIGKIKHTVKRVKKSRSDNDTD